MCAIGCMRLAAFVIIIGAHTCRLSTAAAAGPDESGVCINLKFKRPLMDAESGAE